jgi:hypothetical protein
MWDNVIANPNSQGRSPAEPVPTNYDIVSFARSVMVSDVQKRFADPKFPPELRLQVMKAGIPYNTTSKLSLSQSMKTIEGLRNEAHGLLLFPPREHSYQLDPWADEETTNIIKSAAEQAFLETAIFKLGINHSLPISEHRDWMSGLSSIPETIASRIHYLDLNTFVQGHWSPLGQHLFLDVDWCQKTVTCMDILKLHFPNLKTCVLTLDLYFGARYEKVHQPFDQSFLQWAMGRDANLGCPDTSLPGEASSLMNAFVAKGPGKSQFVRIRDFPQGSYEARSVHYGPLVRVDCEKMAASHEDGSFGTQLFESAYRLARTREQSAASMHMLR